ncbi:RagB/SusD family nutrient uptake outer membrane protein [Fulvivirga sp. M361]|uniref:RagB/SusD family nutrient uptake outer membrane protein n=1 Tax=Fulvivirga sp. M361 TaxID=2594266 RepID=UPI001627A917|nr:RagB/SusD family nutrient uptake outer membrane protein [Fulvivirga sp. M361]
MKKIQQIKGLVLLILAAFFVNSCNIEEEVLDEITADQVETISASDAIQLIAPAYAVMREMLQRDGVWGVNQHSSDETLGPTRGSDWDDNGIWRQLHTHTWDANHTFIRLAWEDLNQGVSRSNGALNTFINQIPGIDANLIAEARVLRSLFMFYIMDMFGQVPFREIDEIDFSVSGRVLTRAEAFEFIRTELEESIADLLNETEVPYGRLTKNAARTLLVVLNLNHEVYLDQKVDARYTDAVNFATDVIGSAAYTLAPAEDYFGMFANDNTETRAQGEGIIVATFVNDLDLGEDNVSMITQTLHYNQRFGGGDGNNDGHLDFSAWNGFTTIADFYNRWDQNDPRFRAESEITAANASTVSENNPYVFNGINRGFLQGQQFDGQGRYVLHRVSSSDNGQVAVADPADANTPLLNFTVDLSLTGNTESNGVRVLKYAPDPNAPVITRTDNDFILWRYSDVYLMRAEAQFRLDGGGQADLDAVRTARNMTSIPISEDALLDERGFELYWEGHRRRDLIRFGRFTDAYTLKDASPAFRTLFPVPQSAIDSDPLLDPTLGNQ